MELFLKGMVKKMIKAVGEKIRQSQNIAVMAHINEDGDALGSVFALCRVLKNMGKNAVCFLELVSAI